MKAHNSRKQTSTAQRSLAEFENSTAPAEARSSTDQSSTPGSDRLGLSMQTLQTIAHQSGIENPLACTSVLSLLAASQAVRMSLSRMLRPLRLSEARFHTLVVLYSFDPTPSTPSDLAYHVGTTRTSITDTLDKMEGKRWIRRQRVASDRRTIHVHLTDDGRKACVFSIYRVLQAAGALAGKLNPAEHRSLLSLCDRLRAHAQTAQP